MLGGNINQTMLDESLKNSIEFIKNATKIEDLAEVRIPGTKDLVSKSLTSTLELAELLSAKLIELIINSRQYDPFDPLQLHKSLIELPHYYKLPWFFSECIRTYSEKVKGQNLTVGFNFHDYKKLIEPFNLSLMKYKTNASEADLDQIVQILKRLNELFNSTDIESLEESPFTSSIEEVITFINSLNLPMQISFNANAGLTKDEAAIIRTLIINSGEAFEELVRNGLRSHEQNHIQLVVVSKDEQRIMIVADNAGEWPQNILDHLDKDKVTNSSEEPSHGLPLLAEWIQKSKAIVKFEPKNEFEFKGIIITYAPKF